LVDIIQLSSISEAKSITLEMMRCSSPQVYLNSMERRVSSLSHKSRLFFRAAGRGLSQTLQYLHRYLLNNIKSRSRSDI